MSEFQEPVEFLQPKHLRVMELVQPLIQTTDFVFINDYLRVQEWVSKTETSSSLEDTIVVLLTLMFQKMGLVPPSKIKEVPIIS